MKLSVMLFPFHAALLDHTLTPHDLVTQLKAHGAQAVETMHCLFHSDPIIFQQLLDEIRDADLTVACHDLELNLITPEDQREAVIRKATREIQFARDVVKTSMVLIYGSQPSQNLSLPAARAVYAQTLKDIAEYADILGVTTTIEDFGMVPELACSAQHCREILLQAQPLPGMTFDIGNFYYAGETTQKAYPILKDFIRHVHIKDLNHDQDGKLVSANVGQGIVDVRAICQSLKKDGYKGFLSVEVEGGTTDHAIQALDFLQTCI